MTLNIQIETHLILFSYDISFSAFYVHLIPLSSQKQTPFFSALTFFIIFLQRRTTMKLVVGIDYHSHTNDSKPSQVEPNWQTKTYTKVISHFFQDEYF